MVSSKREGHAYSKGGGLGLGKKPLCSANGRIRLVMMHLLKSSPYWEHFVYLKRYENNCCKYTKKLLDKA